MRNYEKPDFEITSYESEYIMDTSGGTGLTVADNVQKTFLELHF